MNVKLVLLLMLALLAGGCLEKLQGLQANVPVLNAKVTLGEEVNGTMVIQGIEAYAVEMPRNKAPVYDQFPETFPAVYVAIVQNTTKIGYQVGKSYQGPGVYSLVIGIERNLSKSVPVEIMVKTIDKEGNNVEVQGMRFNWSSEVQSKTFK